MSLFIDLRPRGPVPQRPRGVLFTEPMMLALLAGKKSQTRRLDRRLLSLRAGSKIWAREAWRVVTEEGDGGACALQYRAGGKLRLAEDFTQEQNDWLAEVWMADPAARKQPYREHEVRWHPGIHLPKWAARWWGELIEPPRLEPLQAISEADAIAEATCVARHAATSLHEGGSQEPQACFRATWAEIHGPRAWAENPQVVVLTFQPRSVAPPGDGEVHPRA